MSMKGLLYSRLGGEATFFIIESDRPGAGGGIDGGSFSTGILVPGPEPQQSTRQTYADQAEAEADRQGEALMRRNADDTESGDHRTFAHAPTGNRNREHR